MTFKDYKNSKGQWVKHCIHCGKSYIAKEHQLYCTTVCKSKSRKAIKDGFTVTFESKL